ncbi:hypothetical protein RKD45_003632 [Streptomyces griseus]
MLTRWDERKLEAYAGYIDHVRRCIYSAVLLTGWNAEGVPLSERHPF